MKRGTSGSPHRGMVIAVLRDQAFTFYNIWENDAYTDVSASYGGGDNQWFGGMGRIAHVRGTDGRCNLTWEGPTGFPRIKSPPFMWTRTTIFISGPKEGVVYEKGRQFHGFTPVGFEKFPGKQCQCH